VYPAFWIAGMIVGGGEAWQDGFAAPVKEQEIGRITQLPNPISGKDFA
jgi:hypothetical protein